MSFFAALLSNSLRFGFQLKRVNLPKMTKASCFLGFCLICFLFCFQY